MSLASAPVRSVSLRRWLWIWDTYLIVCFVVVVILLAHETADRPLVGCGAVGLLSLIGVWWLWFGRPAALGADGNRQSWIFVIGLAVLFLGAVSISETSAFALSALCPMIFLSLPQTRAVLVIAAITAVPVLTAVVRAGSLARIPYMVPAAVLSLAFAILAGGYIDRIARQNDERAQMIAELKASRTEVGRLSHEAGVADERARLAAEIHDTLAQGFTSIITLVQAAESKMAGDPEGANRHLAMAARTARDNLAEARALVAALTPAGLRSETLADALRRLADRLAEETGVHVHSDVEGTPHDLRTAVEVVLLRTVQEALANVRKHSGAETVSIELFCAGPSVVLTVTDDGVGFDPSAQGSGYGLPGMRARAEQVNGTLAIQSAAGCGTIVELEVPL